MNFSSFWLNIMSVSFNCFVMNRGNFFIFTACIPLYKHTTIYVNGHLVCIRLGLLPITVLSHFLYVFGECLYIFLLVLYTEEQNCWGGRACICSAPLVDCPNLYSHQKALKVQHQFKSLPVLGIIGLLITAIFLSVYWHLAVVLFCIFKMTNKITHPFMCMGLSESSSVKCLV